MGIVHLGRLAWLLAAPMLVTQLSFGAGSSKPDVTERHEIALSNDGMRCGSRLVLLGDSKGEVIPKCGRAAYEDERYEERRDQQGRRYVVRVDEWMYHLGQGSFLRHLTFEDGRLRDITAGAPVE